MTTRTCGFLPDQRCPVRRTASLTASATAAEPIQIGKERQLFLDDHLIEHTEHLVRRVQPAKKHEANPLIVPKEEWEPEGYVVPSTTASLVMKAVEVCMQISLRDRSTE